MHFAEYNLEVFILSSALPPVAL